MNNMGVFCGPFRGPLEVAVLSIENKIEGWAGLIVQGYVERTTDTPILF